MWQRWNQTTHIFEKSDDDGGIWVPLPLDAAVITEGTLSVDRLPVLTKAKQHAQTAYKDEANVFSLDQEIQKTRPSLILDNGSSANKARVHSRVSNVLNLTNNLSHDGVGWNLDDTTQGGINVEIQVGDIFFQHASAGANPRSVTTPFRITSAGALYERSRTVPIGEWTSYTPTFSVVNSLGNGSANGLWARVGKTVFFEGWLVVGSTTTFNAVLYSMTAPSAYPASAASQHMGSFIIYDSDTTIYRQGILLVTGGTPMNFIYDNGSTMSFMTNTSPITLATGDQIWARGFYRET